MQIRPIFRICRFQIRNTLYQHLLEAEEDLADIRAYDSSRDWAYSEIAAGQFLTLAAYQSPRRPNRK